MKTNAIEDGSNEAILERLSRLEQQNRRMRWLLSAAVVGIATGLFLRTSLVAAPVPVRDVIRANRLEIVGKSGKVQAALSAQPDGAVSLDMYNDQGQEILSLALIKDSKARLVFRDDKGKDRVVLGEVTQDTVGLAVSRKGGRQGIRLVTWEDFGSLLRLSDQAGNELIHLDVMGDIPLMTLSDDNAHPEVVLGVHGRNQSSLTFHTGDERPRIMVGVRDGTPLFSLWNNDWKERAIMQISPEGDASLTLMDKDGKASSKAP